MKPNILPCAAHLSCHYKSHVHSECITLQQGSLHRKLQRLTQIYSLRVLPPHFYYDRKHTVELSNITLQSVNCSPPKTSFSSVSFHSLSLLVCGCRGSGSELTACFSAFNFLHHLTTHFYVTVFVWVYFCLSCLRRVFFILKVNSLRPHCF